MKHAKHMFCNFKNPYSFVTMQRLVEKQCALLKLARLHTFAASKLCKSRQLDCHVVQLTWQHGRVEQKQCTRMHMLQSGGAPCCKALTTRMQRGRTFHEAVILRDLLIIQS